MLRLMEKNLVDFNILQREAPKVLNGVSYGPNPTSGRRPCSERGEALETFPWSVSIEIRIYLGGMGLKLGLS